MVFDEDTDQSQDITTCGSTIADVTSQTISDFFLYLKGSCQRKGFYGGRRGRRLDRH